MGRSYLADDVRGGEQGSGENGAGQAVVRALYPSRLADWKDFERFERQADVLERLDHRRVPRHYGTFSEGEPPSMVYYSVREYVEGVTLEESLEEGRRWDEAGIRRLAREIGAALEALHGREPAVVHRDIKPANLVLTDGDRGAVLIDFGAVREVVRSTVQGGSTVIGTWGYMAPEQFMGEAEPASDLFGLGATLLTCLTHRSLSGVDREATDEMIASADVSEGLERVLRRLCAPRPEDRYAAAADLLEDLDSLEAGGPLVHAERTEQAVAERKQQRQKQLARVSSGPSHRGYLALMIGGFVTAVAAGAVVLSAFGVPMAAGVVLTGGLSGLGVTVARYLQFVQTRESDWKPPASDWIEARAAVVDQKRLRGGGSPGHRVVYEFSTRRGRYRSSLIWPSMVGESPKAGDHLKVLYAPSRPADHRVSISG